MSLSMLGTSGLLPGFIRVKAYAYMSVAMTLLSLPIRLFFNNQGLALFLMTTSWLFVLVLWQEYKNQQPRSQYEADLP